MEKAKLIIISMMCLLIKSTLLFSQSELIYIVNNSFEEDHPWPGRMPYYWTDCAGFPRESPPDTHPNGYFGVTKMPHHGSSYVGMVVRANSTWESIGQRLSKPLKAGVCYKFSVYLALSPDYTAKDKTTQELVNYNKPVKLKIYGSKYTYDKRNLLAETNAVTNTTWVDYQFDFTPDESYSFIILEAAYLDKNPYNGNVLMDDATHLVPCNDVYAANLRWENLYKHPVSQDKVIVTNKIAVIPADKFVEGKIVPISGIKFDKGTSDFQPTAYEKLDQLFDLLSLNPTLVVEIYVHLDSKYASNAAEDLSKSRGEAIGTYLTSKLVDKSRFKIKSMDNAYPLPSKRLNGAKERVEIKIADF